MISNAAYWAVAIVRAIYYTNMTILLIYYVIATLIFQIRWCLNCLE